MKRTRTAVRATLVLVAVAVLAVLIAPQAFAAAPSATATLTGGPVNPGGTTAPFTFSVTATSRQLGSFTLSAPGGWRIVSVGASSGGGTVTSTATIISVTGLSVNSSTPETIAFSATACVVGSSNWTYSAADTQGRPFATPSTVSSSVAGTSCSLQFLNQPRDAKQNQLITADPFQGGSDNLEVQLVDGNGAALTTYPVTVTFGLAFGLDGSGNPLVDENGQLLVNGTLTAPSVATDANGIATFASGLSIAETNEPQFTSYSLAPQTTGSAPTITGTRSDGFNIWETQCPTGGCTVKIRNQNDLYTSPTNGDLSASQLPSSDLPNIVCQGQTVIFADSVFVHEFTPEDPQNTGNIFLKSHVTRQDMKASANNGQAHVQWCIGLPTPWSAKDGPAQLEDTNGNGVLNPLGDLYVGIAPACPNANPQNFAPCVSRQYGDGNGGSFTEGWLPPDPTRRT